ncbi:EutP/PduV family microcompartment system protein [Proteiniclasticum sp. C24MP]|uniref:EutP/PduV family microcompartment system protein n=1 Tax=Proteiniclasticum sp. C24MP TaxID=3374101 RepID=UPI0037546ED1
MKRMLLVGRSESGKTTLTQALKGKKVTYHKTQYINYHDVIIDTPGEYAENKNLSQALALYSYEADVIGLLISATETYSLFPPNVAPCVNREVIGIVTKIDLEDADPDQAEKWLRLTGCHKVFHVSAATGDGISNLLTYLLESPMVMP